MTEPRRKLWTTCEMRGEGITCGGLGHAEPGERLLVSANGGDWIVVVVSVSYPPQRWMAVDEPTYIARYRQ